MNIFLKYITIVFIVLILILIGTMTGCETYSRITYHQQVKEAAKTEACQIGKKECVSHLDTLFSNQKTVSKVEQQEQCSESSVNTLYINNNHQCGHDCNHKESVLDVLEKSDGLLSANGLTYLVTLIVALLATLLLNQIDKVRDLLKENEKLVDKATKLFDKAEENLAQTVNYDFLFSLIKSNYDLAMMIENFTMTSAPHNNQDVLRQIGMLRFRLNKNLSLINECQDNRNTRLESLTKEQHLMLANYLDDTIEALHRSENQNENAKKLLRGSISETERIRDIVNELRA